MQLLNRNKDENISIGSNKLLNIYNHKKYLWAVRTFVNWRNSLSNILPVNYTVEIHQRLPLKYEFLGDYDYIKDLLSFTFIDNCTLKRRFLIWTKSCITNKLP